MKIKGANIMFYRLSQRLKDQQGFTLVELLVVIVIIGVLAGIVVPVYNNVAERAAQAACDSNIRIIEGAVIMYATEENVKIGDLELDVEELAPDYLKEEPACPLDGEYEIGEDGTVTCSHGE